MGSQRRRSSDVIPRRAQERSPSGDGGDDAARPPQAAPGSSLGHYRIKGALGRGGMGEVFLAWDERLERHVAIKRIRSDRPMDDRRRARFRREARAIARLSHPVIVQIFDLIEAADGECIVMEYVEGQSLARLLGPGGLPLSLTLSLAAELAEGLSLAHAKGLLHRDLKPENVIVTPSGHAKILDFGLAYRWMRAPAEGAADSRDGALTDSGLLVGTAHAMSPEQARGSALDPRSDLFALGGVLYAMLTGRSPFRGADLDDTLRRVTSEPPVSVHALRPRVPAALGALVQRLLAKAPADRPASAQEVALTLARIARASEAASPPAAAAAELAALSTASALRPRPAAIAAQDIAAQDIAAQGRDPGGSIASPFEDPSAPSIERSVEDAIALPSPVAVAVDPLPMPVPVLRVIVRLEASQPMRGGRSRSAAPLAARLTRGLLARFHGLEIEEVGARFAALFERTTDAIGFALAFHQAVARAPVDADLDADRDADRGGDRGGASALRDRAPAAPSARVAIALGEVTVQAAAVAEAGARRAVSGDATQVSARVLAVARPRQTLVTREVFELARRAPAGGALDDDAVRWLAHGAYQLAGAAAAIELFEVGVDGFAPLAEPADGEHGRRAVAPGEELTLGWRPAVGQRIPRRPHWLLRERLGEGGAGESWLADHPSGETRVFKFCFDAERLRALKREIARFRLLTGALGHRHDIARVLDWSLSAAPYFIESEYTEAGDLVDWSDACGGLAEIPLEVRLALAAEVADALAAAHSVGVLHRDVKPQNVLITRGHDGRPHARLAELGIGALIDRTASAEREPAPPSFPGAQLSLPEVGAHGASRVSASAAASAASALWACSPLAGALRYTAPELLEGKPATIQADLYALGVMLYQLVAGDLWRALAPGWERDLDDELLIEDIAALVDRAPERRPASAAEVGQRLRTLEERRRQRRAVERQRAAAERQRAARRRLASPFAVLMLALLTIISALAYRADAARQRADEARAVAEERRHQAEALVLLALGELRGQLAPPGELGALDALGARVLAYFATTSREGRSVAEQATLAAALRQLGELRAEAGAPAEATATLRESLRLTAALAERDPTSDERQVALREGHRALGLALGRQRELRPARAELLEHLRVAELLVARAPRDRARMRELARAHGLLGSLERELGDSEAARRALGAAAGLAETLLAQEPDDEAQKLELLQLHASLGELLLEGGELAGAQPWLMRALEAAQALAARAPRDARRQQLLGAAHRRLGELRRWRGELAEALVHARAALAIAERRAGAASDASDDDAHAGLAQRLHEVAELYRVSGELALAQPLLERERQLLDELLAGDPAAPPWRLARARCDLAFAALLAARQQTSAAVAWARAATGALEQLAAQRPEDRQLAGWLPYAWWQLGAVQRQAGLGDEARASWEQGLGHARTQARHSDAPPLRDLQARLALALGRRDEAQLLLAGLDAIGYREHELSALRPPSGQPPR